MLALFFVSKWGRSHVNCDAENAARHWACLAGRISEELTRVRGQQAAAFWQGAMYATMGRAQDDSNAEHGVLRPHPPAPTSYGRATRALRVAPAAFQSESDLSAGD